MNVTFVHNGITYPIALERGKAGDYVAMLGDRIVTFEARRLANGAWLLGIGGEQVTVYVAAEGSRRHVSAGGASVVLSLPEPRRAQRGRSGAGGDLTAQMPGQVIDVAVQAGNAVGRGQTLVILEAMKMETTMYAERAGRVAELLVTTGTQVDTNDLMLRME